MREDDSDPPPERGVPTGPDSGKVELAPIPAPRGSLSSVFIPAGRLGKGPDNRKRSQTKLISFPVWPGRRKPFALAGNVRPEDAAIGGGA